MVFDSLDRNRKVELLLAIALAVAFIGYIVAIYVGDIETEVVRDRYWKNVVPLFNGEIPIMEYPPFSLVFMVIPYLFAQSPFGYNVAYVIFTYIFTLIGMELIRRIAERMKFDQAWAMIAYAVLMVLLLEFIADRYDIFPAVMAIASFYLLMVKKPAWAFIILALATATKLYPAMFLPIFLLIYLSQKDWKGFAGGIFWYAVGILVVVVPVMLIEPEMITNFLSYHTNRPLEVGSTVATLIYPFSMIGLTEVHIMPVTDPGSFGSDNLIGPVPDAVAPLMTPIMVATVLLVIIYYAYARRRSERKDQNLFLVSCAMLLAVLAFIVCGKVFSSQYLIWAVPFYVLVMMASNDRAFNRKLVYLTIAYLILTQVNFAYIYGYLGGGAAINDLAMISMLVRNLMVVATGAMVFLEMRRVVKQGMPCEERDMDVPFGF